MTSLIFNIFNKIGRNLEIGHNLQHIQKNFHTVRKIKLKHVVISENILDEFIFGHGGIKIRVTIALAKVNYLFFSNHQQKYSINTI